MLSKRNIVIAGPILARDEAEADRLLHSVRSLARHGLPVVLADGGSPGDFVERLQEIPGVTVEVVADRSLRLVSQIRQALPAACAGADYVLYTEPDKQWFFENRLTDYLRALETEDKPGILVAARNAASFATFPPVQQLPESLLNRLCAETLNLPTDADLTYGPLLIRADLAPLALQITENVGWGWRIFLMAACRRLGAPIALWTADLPCPEDQRGENNERAQAYRLEQMAQNVRGLALGLRTPLE